MLISTFGVGLSSARAARVPVVAVGALVQAVNDSLFQGRLLRLVRRIFRRQALRRMAKVRLSRCAWVLRPRVPPPFGRGRGAASRMCRSTRLGASSYLLRAGGGNLGTAEPRHFHEFRLEFAVFTCGSQVPTFFRGLRLAGQAGKRSVLCGVRSNSQSALARPTLFPYGGVCALPSKKWEPGNQAPKWLAQACFLQSFRFRQFPGSHQVTGWRGFLCPSA
jgi:hypothetical protein